MKSFEERFAEFISRLPTQNLPPQATPHEASEKDIYPPHPRLLWISAPGAGKSDLIYELKYRMREAQDRADALLRGNECPSRSE